MPPPTLRPARILRLPLRPQHSHQNPFSSPSFRTKSTQRPNPKDSGSKSDSLWKPIPVALGIAFLGAFQLYRINKREREEVRRLEPDDDASPTKRRQRIRPSGPWTVQVMSTIPLKALSRWWGWFNSIELPYYMRVPGFKLYGWVFGVNFDEIAEEDLHNFKNLAEFFYRTIRPECRPLDTTQDALLSPADGRVIQFGIIEGGEVEQVKGVTYSVDALLGETKTPSASSNVAGSSSSPKPSGQRSREGDEETIREDEEFAQVNGISYTLPDLLSGGDKTQGKKTWWQRIRGSTASSPTTEDQSTASSATSEKEVARDLASSPNAPKPWYAPSTPEVPTTLYYCVVYLAPGDYHRFHSPVSWIVESRRHFAGELYSVSPYLQRTLPGLFTLNERVVLLGRWKYGFFSYTPVGATNVGSIIINFDKELRTNSLLTDTRADREAEAAKQRGEVYAGYAEAGYSSASSVLGGHALRKGEEMGGFQLGSTIVLVFEAPKGRRPTFDEGFGGEGRKGGWRWGIEKGMKVRVGERLGWVEQEGEQTR